MTKLTIIHIEHNLVSYKSALTHNMSSTRDVIRRGLESESQMKQDCVFCLMSWCLSWSIWCAAALSESLLSLRVAYVMYGPCSEQTAVAKIANNKAHNFITSDNALLKFEAIKYLRSATLLCVVGLERGPHSHVSITEELLEWKSSGSGSTKQRSTAVWIRCADHATPSIRKSWHYLRNNRRSLGRYSLLLTKTTEFSFEF
jgi:hypothetical protein